MYTKTIAFATLFLISVQYDCATDEQCTSHFASYCYQCSADTHFCVINDPCNAECFYAYSCNYGYICNTLGKCVEDPTYCYKSHGCTCYSGYDVCENNLYLECENDSVCTSKLICFDGACIDPNNQCKSSSDCQESYTCNSHHQCEYKSSGHGEDYYLTLVIGFSIGIPVVFVLGYSIAITIVICKWQKKKAMAVQKAQELNRIKLDDITPPAPTK